jgi:hypothetical protein
VRTGGSLGENFAQKPATIGVTTGSFIPSIEFENANKTVSPGDKWYSYIPEPPLPVTLILVLLVVIAAGTYKIFEGAYKFFATPDDPQEIPKSPEGDRQPIPASQEILGNALAELRMQDAFRDAFVTQARNSTSHEFVMVEKYGPQTKEDVPSSYYELVRSL